MFDSSEIIPDPKDFNPKRKSLFIFDDIMTEKNQDPASNFYTRGRHNNCSCIYISQNYHKLPRQTIRTNSNFLILFRVVYRKRVSSTFLNIFTHISTFFHPHHYISQTVAINYTIVKRNWGIPRHF